MADAILIQPDTEFLRAVIAGGGGDLKKCYQCATCSVACELSPEDAPFPRRQMIEAQWGLRDRLMRDPSIWLCHNCGKCTTRCPRGARPGDVLAALRRETVRRLSAPRFLGEMAAAPKAWPLLFLLPAVIFLAIAWLAPAVGPEQPLEFASVFPLGLLEPLFFAVAGLALLAFVVPLVRYARLIRPQEGGGVLKGLLPAVREIAFHSRFRSCEQPRWRVGHLLTMWGFIGLVIVGTVAGIGTMTGVLRTPLPLGSPLKIFANVSAVVALAGVVLVLMRRIGDPGQRRGSVSFDWFFLLTLAGALLTGILSEGLRLMEIRAMYGVYVVHLTLVFALMLYAPYTKFAHLAYRTLAMASTFKSVRRT